MISDTLIKETFYRWAEQNGTTNIKVSHVSLQQLDRALLETDSYSV